MYLALQEHALQEGIAFPEITERVITELLQREKESELPERASLFDTVVSDLLIATKGATRAITGIADDGTTRTPKEIEQAQNTACLGAADVWNAIQEARRQDTE
jgi:hypothetical protein